MCCRPPDKLKVVHGIPAALRRALSSSSSRTIVLMLCEIAANSCCRNSWSPPSVGIGRGT
jgi:hypothetical protein